MGFLTINESALAPVPFDAGTIGMGKTHPVTSLCVQTSARISDSANWNDTKVGMEPIRISSYFRFI